MKIFARLRPIRIVALALAALCLTTGLAAAGEMADGYKFTLPVQAHWNSVTLPPGDYTFTLTGSGIDTRVLVKKEGNYVAVLLTSGGLIEKKSSDSGALNLVLRNGAYYVRTLSLPNQDVDFHYLTPKAGGRFTASNSKTVRSIPVLAAQR